MDWTDTPQTTVVSRLTDVPLATRVDLRAGAFTPERHAANFDAFPVLRQIELGGPTPVRESVEDGARLVFWNVERLRHLDDIAVTLAALKPDAMLLSEIDRGMARSGNSDRVLELAEKMGASYHYAVEFIELDLGDVHEQRHHAGEVNVDGFHGAATLSKVAMHDPALIRIERRGDWFGLDRHEPRVGSTIALCARIVVAGQSVLLVNVHLESHDNPAMRATDVQHILTLVEQLAPGGPVAMGGDFNTSTFSYGERHGDPDAWRAQLAADPMRLMRPYLREPLFDVAGDFGYDWTACNVPDAATTRYPAGSTRPPAKIDWVFTRGLQATDATVIAALRADGSPSSDHEALFVVVKPA